MKKKGWPESGDFVVATIERITRYGAYVIIDEYDKEGFLHVSEVASGWIRNVRNFIREGQKAVLRVLRVNERRGHVDLSLKRVTKHQRREALRFWKRGKKAEGILRSASEKLQVPFEGVYEKAGVLIEDRAGGLYEGMEKTAREGVSVLLSIGIPKDMAITIAELAKEKIKPPMVKIKGILELQCLKPKGVTLIRDALLSAYKIERPEGVRVTVYVVSPPRYRIEVLAKDYKMAERALQEATETVLKTITNFGGQGTFKRER